MKRLVLIPSLLLLVCSSWAVSGALPTPRADKRGEQGQGAATSAASPVIQANAQNIRSHVRFLSSDLLEGRGTGQRGGELAAEYIATEFNLYGLRPAGDNNTYFQKVPMVGITTDPASSISLVQSGKSLPLHPYQDIVATDESQNAANDIDSELVFVGYGIDAPEYNWNDYKDANLKGKILLMLVNEPPSDDPNFFKGKALTYYGRWTYKFEEAARRGAVGAIIIHKTDMASYGWDVVRNSWAGERAYLRAENQPKLKLAGWVQLSVGQDIASSIKKSVEDLIKMANSRDFQPVPLPIHVKAHMISKIRPFDSNNVLAELPGTSPELGKQAVMYSAHYDHLGIRPGVQGDNIYNGAVDNATGVGMLLEIARLFATQIQPPARTVLFAAVTGEEQGLLGSEYLGRHLPIPAGDISLGLNFDGILPSGIPESIQVSGAERTNFYPVVEQAAKDFGLEIKPDSNPGAGHYYRSDHFSFARVGVPSFSVQQGLKFRGRPQEWGVQRETEYDEKNYHQPSDEFQPDWDFSGLAYLAQFSVDLGKKAAEQQELVQWIPGDEFEAARKASESPVKTGQ